MTTNQKGKITVSETFPLALNCQNIVVLIVSSNYIDNDYFPRHVVELFKSVSALCWPRAKTPTNLRY